MRDRQHGPALARLFLTLTLAALLCVARPVASERLGGASGAEPMRPDTTSLLMRMDATAAPECAERAIVSIEATASPDAIASPGAQRAPDTAWTTRPWRERWLMDRCGAMVAWEVRYTPTDDGALRVAAGLAVDDGDALTPPGPGRGNRPGAPPSGRLFLVTTTADAGIGSLSQAILDANASPNVDGPDQIRFAIPGAAPHEIAVAAALPAITDAVVIDGASQRDGMAQPDGGATVARVTIDGGLLSRPADGLVLRAGSSTIRGLGIRGFDGDAIRLEGGGSSTIEGNVIGDETTGDDEERSRRNTGNGIAIVDSPDNTIGGSDLSLRNIIAGNGGIGVRVVGAASIGNAILGNRIVGNAGGGIDLDAVTTATGGTPLAGPNRLQRPPVLEATSFTPARAGRPADILVEGRLDAAPDATYRVELFATTAGPQGERFLAAMEVTTGADGQSGFQFHLPAGVHSRDLLTATATDVAGDTSEFSAPLPAAAILVTWNTGTGNWNVAANWSPAQVPATGDDVVIAANGANTTFAVTVNANASLNTLSVGGGSGTQTLASGGFTLTLAAASAVNANGVLTMTNGTLTGLGALTIDGTFNWSGGVMSGAAVTTVNGPFNLSGLTAISGRTLNNNSTAVWTSAANLGVRTGGGSVINNNGTWDSRTDDVAIVNYYGGATTFNNTGTFKKSAGTGTTTLSVPFVNTGSVDVQTGTLLLYGGSSTTGFIVSGAAATLLFGSGTFDLNAGTTFSGPGTVLVNTNGTVNVNTAISIPAATTLTLVAGILGGTGTLTIDGTFNWTGGRMSDAGVTTVNGPFNLSGLDELNIRTLNNNSTVVWTAANNFGVRTGGGSVINNNGTWDSRTDGVSIVPYFAGATTFNNIGTFKKSAGTGTTTVSVSFINTGTVDVQTGTFLLYGGNSTKSFIVSGAAATLLFGSGTFDLNAGTTFSGPGTVLLNTGGTVNVNSAVTIPVATTFNFVAGTLAGTGAFAINGPFNWSGGLMTGAATTTVNGVFNISGLTAISGNRILNNATTAHWAAGAGVGMWTGTGSVINNNGIWDIQVDGGAIVNHYGGATTFNNIGTFRKSAGPGSLSMQIPFVNSGTVDVQNGTVDLNGGGSSTNALNVSGATSTLLFSAGVFNLNAGATVSGPGTVLLNSSGTVNVNSAVTIPVATTFNFLVGTLAGTGPLTANGTFNWSGGLMTGATTTTVNGPLNISGLTGISGSHVLNNTATASWTAGAGVGMWTGTGSVINNSGTWDVQIDGGAIVNHYGGATTFNNLGTFKKSAGAGSMSVSIPFNNSGTVDAQSGTLNMSSSSYTQTAGVTRLTGGAFTSTTNINIQGGALAGSGTVTGPVIVSGTGALAPGLSAGTLALAGAYTQQGPNGAFNVEIGGTTPGTQFDRVNVTGAASLAGVLNVSLINGFIPASGDSFTIMTYPSHTGTLTLNLPAITCLGWRVDQGPTAIVLTAVSRPAEILGVTMDFNNTGLAWDPVLPVGGAVYDVLRGNLDHLPVGTGGGQVCLANGVAGTTTTDAAMPGVGAGYWYLVREEAAGCGVGSYGFATSGVERTSLVCP